VEGGGFLSHPGGKEKEVFSLRKEIGSGYQWKRKGSPPFLEKKGERGGEQN